MQFFFYGNKFILFVALGTKLAQFLFLQNKLVHIKESYYSFSESIQKS